jgi:hypothetical protein
MSIFHSVSCAQNQAWVFAGTVIRVIRLKLRMNVIGVNIVD